MRFVQWLAETPGSIALHESLYMYPLVESVHVLTLCLFVGTATMIDLRLLGFTMKRVPVSEVMRRLLPWTIAGFIVMVVTGALLAPGERTTESRAPNAGVDKAAPRLGTDAAAPTKPIPAPPMSAP